MIDLKKEENMVRITSRLCLLIVLIIAMNFFFACRSNLPTDDVNHSPEIWEIELSGNADGKLTMNLALVQTGKDIYSLSGNISGLFNDHLWGSGDAEWELTGKIINKSIEINFSGSSNMAEGPSQVTGKAKGTISKLEGSGTWDIFIHARGKRSGTFAMKRVESTQ